MYTKAFPYNDDVIFYFDMYDNKYVAKGRTLAWRTNNPGLVHSHSTIKQRPIGSCGQVAIFSSPSQGEKALYEWIHLKKYYHSTLIAIAKHYDPKSPEKFLQKLCRLTSLQEAANVTLLDESISGPFEHNFDSECYQIKVKEQLKKYKNWQSLNDAKK